MYSSDALYLFASTNDSHIIAFNASTGDITNLALYVTAPVQCLSTLTTGIITFINNNGTIFTLT